MKKSYLVTGAGALVSVLSLLVTACAGGSEEPEVSSVESAVWTGDIGIGGAPGSDLALASWGPGRYDLFYTTGGHLKHRWSQGTWSAEEDLGGDLASAPAAVSWASNRIDIFAMGRQNQLMHLWWDGSWHPWESLGGLLNSAPAVASWAPGRLDIFYAAVPTGLGHVWFDQGWHPHEVLDPSTVYGAPAAVSWAAGRIDVFARMAPSGGPLRHKWFQQGWSSWEALGGNIASAPAATSWGANRLDAFYLGPDGALKTQYFDGSWHAEASLSGSYSGAPGAVASSNRIDVVLPQVSLGIAQRTWTPSVSVPPPWLLWPDGCQAPTGIVDAGYPDFRANADVNGDGYADYCRFVGDPPNVFLSCQLACPPGGYGVPYGFNSETGLDWGLAGTRQMRDSNGDGRADFCRAIGNGSTLECDAAGDTGFSPETFQCEHLTDFFAGGYSDSVVPIADPLNLHVRLQRPTGLPASQSSVVVDGVSYTTTYFENSSYPSGFGGADITLAPVTAATQRTHSAVLITPCGTESKVLTLTPVTPTAPHSTMSLSPTQITAGGSTVLTYATYINEPHSVCQAYTSQLVVSRASDGAQLASFVAGAFGDRLTVAASETTDYTLITTCTNAPMITRRTSVRLTVVPPNQPPPPPAGGACGTSFTGVHTVAVFNGTGTDTLSVWSFDEATGAANLAGDIGPGDTITVTLPDCRWTDLVAVSAQKVNDWNATFGDNQSTHSALTAADFADFSRWSGGVLGSNSGTSPVQNVF